MVIATGCSTASTYPSQEGSTSQDSGSTAASPPVPATAEFSRADLSFHYPPTWDLALVAEGPKVARGCSAGFWAVRVQFQGEGFVSVSRCPSTFVWPPKGQSLEEALQEELVTRNRSDLTSIVEFEGDELGGIPGIGGTITLDPKESTLFGIDGGANGIILRGANAPGAVDAGKPDLYEVVCLWTLEGPGEVGEGCAEIISSFHFD